MRVAATFDRPTAQSRLIMLVCAEPGQRFSVAARLAGLPPVDEVHLTTGACELIAQASFSSDAEALEFYVRHVESGPGIASSELTHVIETVSPRTGLAHDVFDEFDTKAADVYEVRDLYDLACDTATATFGTGRIAVGTTGAAGAPDTPLYNSDVRWRGLSARYIEMVCTIRRAESVIIPTVIEQGQHLFVPDAQADPLFRQLADLVALEGFHSFLAVPVRSGDVIHGALNLYYDTVIPYRQDLVAQVQELADLLAKHIARVLHENAVAGTAASS
jgi:GAF domain-containing protein